MTNPTQNHSRNILRIGWIIACSVGASCAIALAMIIFSITETERDFVLLRLFVGAVLAGLSLGGLQALVLRRRGVRIARWMTASVLGAVGGSWLLVLIVSGMQLDGFDETSLGVNVLLGGGFGFCFGAVVGALQWVGGGRMLSARHWIAANMAGWMPAMAIIIAGGALTTPAQPFPIIVLAGIAGVALGVVTSVALPTR